MHVPMKSPEALLSILNIKGIGDVMARRIVQKFAHYDDVLQASDEDFKDVVNRPVRESLRDADLLKRALDRAHETIDEARRKDAVVLTRFDDAYPRRLKAFDESPLVLYVRGDLSGLEQSVAVVGTRQPSHYGEVVTDRLTSVLAESGLGIVSGLAYGVDSIAHDVALRHGVPTIAFVGCGLDSIQSSIKRDLARAIVDGGGAIVSEQPFGTKDDSGTLIRRNRLQSGSSVATFITQCGVASGTMQTMRYAVYQGRPVYVPMPPDNRAEEPENEGVMVLAGTVGSQLAERIDLKKSIVDILEAQFADRPVAQVLRGRDDYPRMLMEIRSLLEQETPVLQPAL